MKYVDEYRAANTARHIAGKIHREVRSDRTYRFMEFCGGHTHAIFRYAIPELLPGNIEMLHGPGCPVCVLPMAKIDAAMALAEEYGVILCCYGDVMRVPGSDRRNLLKAKSQGADIRMLYACADALKIARDTPDKPVVFFAIGFETTTPPTALIIQQAKKQQLSNFSVFCNHVLTPPAIASVMEVISSREAKGRALDGVIGPGHVSTVIGSQPYEHFARHYQTPVVIAGFEPLDLLQAILMLVRQVNQGDARVENEFARAVTREGNLRAQELMAEVFEIRAECEWRGLGQVPHSGVQLNPQYRKFDAEHKFTLSLLSGREHLDCECPAILSGLKTPVDCPLFGTRCSPENPIGSCMVSSEGACAAYYHYGRRCLSSSSTI